MRLATGFRLAFPFLFVLAWEIAARVGAGALPSLIAILADITSNFQLYLDPAGRTAVSASVGLAAGSLAGLAAALSFCRFPALKRLFLGVNIALFAMPPIIIGPILALFFADGLPQIIAAALLVYFPVMTAFLSGLETIDARLADVVKINRGGFWDELRLVRLGAARPALAAGMKAAAPMAVLGAMLGEFGSGGSLHGGNWGLGHFLLASLGQANPARLWGIGLAGMALALAGYGLFAAMGGGRAHLAFVIEKTAQNPKSAIGWPMTAAAFFLPFILWQGLVSASGVSAIIAPGPLDVAAWLANPPEDDAWARLGGAVMETVPVAALGLLLGLAAAFLAALAVHLAPGAAKIWTMTALFLQSMPLVTLAPILYLFFGRDLSASLAMAVLVTFFPAFVLIVEGFRQTPGPLADFVRLCGGGATDVLRLVSIRASAPYLLAAIRLAAPRAVLGVMVAEWLLSGKGLGALLSASRAEMDARMTFAAALAGIFASILLYGLAAVAERRMGSDREAH